MAGDRHDRRGHRSSSGVRGRDPLGDARRSATSSRVRSFPRRPKRVRILVIGQGDHQDPERSAPKRLLTGLR
ncbi:hypothetical protein KPATCC21470_8573 [Kitasatospora purpeofusca]